MKTVRTLQDAEFLIGQLFDRIEKLENANRTKIVERTIETRVNDVDNEALDIIFGIDKTQIYHELLHIFKNLRATLIESEDLTLEGTKPELLFNQDDGSAPLNKIRLYADKSGSSDFYIAINLYYSGSTWNLDDTSVAGSVFVFNYASAEFYTATAGTNPRTLTSRFKIDSGNRFYNNGVAILNTQQSDPGAGPSSPSITTLGIGGTAGATYTGVEQGLINNLLTNNTNTNTNVTNLKTAVDALITNVNNIRTALRNHGLCA